MGHHSFSVNKTWVCPNIILQVNALYADFEAAVNTSNQKSTQFVLLTRLSSSVKTNKKTILKCFCSGANLFVQTTPRSILL